jgi:hypothetical protein
MLTETKALAQFVAAGRDSDMKEECENGASQHLEEHSLAKANGRAFKENYESIHDDRRQLQQPKLVGNKTNLRQTTYSSGYRHSRSQTSPAKI